MSTIRLIAWNCRSGSINKRLAQLAEHRPDVTFLQECTAFETPPLGLQILAQDLNATKAIAIACQSEELTMSALPSPLGVGQATLAALLTGRASFSVIGIWRQGPSYVEDVMMTLEAQADLLASGRTIVMGDLNSGTPLYDGRSQNPGHDRIVDHFKRLEMVSAYHAFHSAIHGAESHATYHHLFKPSKPWHIDFCFIPNHLIAGLRSFQILDGPMWEGESDHRPLVVELEF